jgi:Leucine-rich repeat (LRR) protein
MDLALTHTLKRIAEVKKHRLKRLDLSNWGTNEKLTRIPDEVFELEDLEVLNLSRNLLTSVPESIFNLRNLRSLDFSGNQLESVPASISRLDRLNSLYLGSNRLNEIPESIGGLRELTLLYVAGNRLRAIPASISQLELLTWLDLSRNQLTGLPEGLFHLHNLAGLYLSSNRLTMIPNGLFQVNNLTSLGLGSNQLTILPDAVSQLEKLSWLDVSDNQLTLLPAGIAQLPNLRWLQLNGNPIETPPPEVLTRGVVAIKDYLKQLKAEGEDYLYEAKLLILGEGGAGKTTLARKIENPKYQLQEEDSTKGIEIIPWRFPMNDGEVFRVNIWDFGGQEIYHATHQFFLTRRSLYALVADTRKEDTDFYYWLNVVELLSDNSPLLIIKNEKQERHREINENLLRGQFSNLKETLATNLATDRGLPRVIEEIKHHISRLPHIGTTLPKTWVKVRQALEKNSSSYITIENYFDICQENGFTEMKDKLQLSGYLHDLGVCLHFQDDPLLKKTVILKPKWGTDAVYKVLDNKTVLNKLGKFNREDLVNIWSETDYSNMQDELLQLMINFKLAYRIPNSDFYIAPQLLTENQPQYEWNETDNLILRYTYESFMPKGIITQFIVAMHKWIAEQKCVWRSGVILEKVETKAEVIEYYGKREIKIRVTGKHKKELTTIVTYELDQIHALYRRLRYNKLIPCNCEECTNSQEPHFYRFEILQQFLDDRQELIQCQKSYYMVDVRGLIDEVVVKGFNLLESLRDQVFISYSHLDGEWLTKLQIMLKPLMRNNEVSVWADTDIQAGAKWKDELTRSLYSAKVAVLLVSPNFLASDFIAENELPILLRAAEHEGLKILWVAVGSCLYNRTEIANYQSVNDPSKPLESLSPAESNRVLVEVCEKIIAALDR